MDFNFVDLVSILAPIATLIVATVTYFSFAYGRKPLIHIKRDKIIDYDFIIKNVSKNPAKNIYVKIKLTYNGNTQDIGEYTRDYLNPEEEDVIKDMPEKIESKLENLNLLIKFPYRWPENPDPAYGNNVVQHIIDIEKGHYKENELQTLYSHKINENFKISIKFEVTCKSDIPLNIPLLNTHTFLYNFEISYTMLDLDFVGKEDPDTYFSIGYGYHPNFNLFIKPSTGKWNEPNKATKIHGDR